MMSVLDNPKHERFSQELAKGLGYEESYELAGYAPHRQNAYRLMTTNDDVQARVAELQDRLAARTEMTLQRLSEMFLEDREFARKLEHSAAAVSATDKLARLHGFMIDRKEIGTPGEFDRMSAEELRAYILRESEELGLGVALPPRQMQ